MKGSDEAEFAAVLLDLPSVSYLGGLRGPPGRDLSGSGGGDGAERGGGGRRASSEGEGGGSGRGRGPTLEARCCRWMDAGTRPRGQGATTMRRGGSGRRRGRPRGRAAGLWRRRRRRRWRRRGGEA